MEPPRPKSVALALLRAMRPHQWVKNGLLFVGLLFTLNEFHPLHAYLHTLLAFVLFCLLSGATYLINDLRDIDADRLHPIKRLRPIASGELPTTHAWAAVAILLPLTLTLASVFLGTAFFVVAVTYFVLTLAYSIWLKHQVLVDVMTVALGFVLRAVAGSFAVPVPPSSWLLLLTFLLALFVGLNKRRAELVALGGNTPTRKILAEYSIAYLDPMITLVATTCLVTYLLYTILSPTGLQHGFLMATSLFVLYGLFRYLYLTYQRGMGEAPEAALARDRAMQVTLVLWILSVAAAILSPATLVH